jgi:iron complex transport system ATP-binding protein
MNKINIKDLEFSYDKRKILKKLKFDISKLEFITILGPNGCGKTTLLKNLCAYEKPDSGMIMYDNEQIKHLSAKERAKKMAVVHQQNDIGFDFSVKDIVLMGRYPHLKKFESEKEDDFKWVEYVMKETEVFHLKDKSIAEVSGGERQRIVIARALAQQTDLIYLDEPISHLDIKHQIGILKLCKKLIKEKNLTVVMTLHDINLASRFSDKILLMCKGEIKAYGKPEDVLTIKNIENVYEVQVEQFRHTDGYLYTVPRGE